MGSGAARAKHGLGVCGEIVLSLICFLSYPIFRADHSWPRGVVTSPETVSITVIMPSRYFGRGGYGACPGLRPKGHSSRSRAANELPGCRSLRQPFSSVYLKKEFDVETIIVTKKTRPLIVEAMIERGFVERGSFYHAFLEAAVAQENMTEIRIWRHVRLVFK